MWLIQKFALDFLKAYLLCAKTHKKQPERGHFPIFFWGSMPPDPPIKAMIHMATAPPPPPPYFALGNPPF